MMNTKSVVPTPKDHQNGHRDVFGSLHDRIDRVFDDFSRGFHLPSSMLHTVTGSLDITPRLDMSEDDKTLTVNLELPGVDEKDVEISLADDLLTIKGEKKSETEDKNKDYHLVERRYGSFSRSIKLPQGIEPDEVKAKYNNGVLRITMPKPADLRQKVKKIEIQG